MSSNHIDNKRTGPSWRAADARIARQILDALTGMRFGSVEVIVHDGQLVQMERREKVRFDKLTDASSGTESSVNRHTPET